MPLVACATRLFGDRIHRLFERGAGRVREALGAARRRTWRACAWCAPTPRRPPRSAASRRATSEYVERPTGAWRAGRRRSSRRCRRSSASASRRCSGSAARWCCAAPDHVGEFVTFNFFLAKLVWPMIAIGWVVNLVQRGRRLARVRRGARHRAGDRRSADARRRASGIDRSDRRCARAPRPRLPLPPRAAARLSPASTSRSRPARWSASSGGRGAGKTTLLSLVPRLLDPPPGTLFVDGLDVRTLPLARSAARHRHGAAGDASSSRPRSPTTSPSAARRRRAPRSSSRPAAPGSTTTSPASRAGSTRSSASAG